MLNKVAASLSGLKSALISSTFDRYKLSNSPGNHISARMSEFHLICLASFLLTTVAFCQYPNKTGIILLEDSQGSFNRKILI